MTAATSLSGAARGADAPPKPNFLFILVDDLGWADLSCYGSTYHESLNTDRLAAQGMRFTDAYAAAPVCSPTRASILTGKYPATVHLTDFIAGHWRPYAKLVVPKFNLRLPAEQVALPEALKGAGYVSACFGKWHLGGRGSGPADHGFDVAGGGPSRNDKKVASLTDKTLDFMARHKDRPFFVHLCHHTVHIPLEADEKLVAKYKAKLQPGQKYPQQANPTYAAMIEQLDQSVGRLMSGLDELGLAKKTVVVFTSDNGGLKRIFTGKGPIVTSNAPLRDEKGTLYEGGIRVPLIIRWPGVVEAGTTCRVPVSSIDFYPTFLRAAGVPPSPKHEPDGLSLLPLLEGRGGLGRDALYWHYPHYHHTPPCGAVREGDLKLIEFYEDGRLELYDLAKDLGEKNDLADQMPEKAAALRDRLHRWLQDVDAQMPTPNPDYDPQRAGEWGRRRRKKK